MYQLKKKSPETANMDWLDEPIQTHENNLTHQQLTDDDWIPQEQQSSKQVKRIVTVKNGELDKIVDLCELELTDTGEYFHSSGQIVRVAFDPFLCEKFITPVTRAAITRSLDRRISWRRKNKNSDGPVQEVVIDPPTKYIALLHETETYPHLPHLIGIARQPFFRADKTLMNTTGYDAQTGYFGSFTESEFSIPENPTRQDAIAALNILSDLLEEFAFAAPCDKNAAIAAILTAATRISISTAPMFHVSAHQIATGKSYLTSIFSSFASSTSPSPLAFPTSEEECQKTLIAALMRSPPTIVFDNLTNDILAFKSLCSATTEESLTGRILGASKVASVSTKTLLLSSGNNVGPIKDMSRRCLTIKLDPKVEIPTTRNFAKDPLELIRRNRAYYVSLALMIVRAWFVNDCPITKCKPLNSYGEWTKYVRQPLMWLGLSDPAERIFTQLTEDPDREQLGQLLLAWRGVFMDSYTSIREVVEKSGTIALGADELREVIGDLALERGEINRKRLGRWIARHQGQIVDGLRFVRGPSASGVERWRVMSVTMVSGVLGVTNFSEITDLSAKEEDGGVPF